MLEMGNWLKLNGEAVYGTRVIWLPGVRGVSTRKGDKVFVFVTRWTRERRSPLPALPAKVGRRRHAGNGFLRTAATNGRSVSRKNSTRPPATIVELTLDCDAMKLRSWRFSGLKNLALR